MIASPFYRAFNGLQSPYDYDVEIETYTGGACIGGTFGFYAFHNTTGVAVGLAVSCYNLVISSAKISDWRKVRPFDVLCGVADSAMFGATATSLRFQSGVQYTLVSQGINVAVRENVFLCFRSNTSTAQRFVLIGELYLDET